MWGTLVKARRGTAGALGALGLALCSTAAEAAKPIYFHKANVDRATFVAEFSDCSELAGGVRAPRYNTYSSNMIAAAAGGFFAGFFGSRERRRMVENVLRTCMADKGYRRVEATAALLTELRRLSEEDRLDRLFALAASSTPVGTVLPR